MNLSRRGLLIGGAALIASPAIVRASSLMRVRACDVPLVVGPQITATEVLRRQHAALAELQDRIIYPPYGKSFTQTWLDQQVALYRDLALMSGPRSLGQSLAPQTQKPGRA